MKNFVEDLEEGFVVEDIEFEAREEVDHSDGTEEVIYVGGRLQSSRPRKK